MFYGRNYTKARSFKLFFRGQRFVEEVSGGAQVLHVAKEATDFGGEGTQSELYACPRSFAGKSSLY